MNVIIKEILAKFSSESSFKNEAHKDEVNETENDKEIEGSSNVKLSSLITPHENCPSEKSKVLPVHREEYEQMHPDISNFMNWL